MENKILVSEVKHMSKNIFDAFKRLTPQLSSTSAIPTHSDLEDIINARSTRLLVANKGSEDNIVGTLTLVIFRIPTGVRAWIEDVVVEADNRGLGIGKSLCYKAIEIARKEGSRTIDLTSRPTREVANSLYKSVGFKVRNTNVYRIELN